MEKIALLPQQKEVKDKFIKGKFGALFMEAGTAKTRPTIELVNSVPGVDLVVWVGPLRTIKPKDNIPSIIDEINKWGGFKCENIIYIGVESIGMSDREYLQLYKKISTAWRCFLVVDESLKIKNHDAKRTQRLLTLSKMVEYKLILNGTPITRNLLDLWSQMEFLSPKILGMPIAEFKNTFCEVTTVTKTFGHKSYTKEFISGYENIDYLYSLIRHYVFECDLQLNIKQIYSDIAYEISEDDKKEYDFIKEKYLDDEKLLAMNNNIFLAMTTKMQMGYCVSESKFQALEKHFESYPEDKHIIFARFIISQEELKKRFPKATVLSYQKESLGLNLQHLPYTIYWDKIWDYGLKHQGSRRSFRTGQEQDVHYFDMTGNVGLEKLFDLNIQKKVSQAEYFKSISKKELKEIL
jgi:SNF2 family DNA or RNA helicase